MSQEYVLTETSRRFIVSKMRIICRSCGKEISVGERMLSKNGGRINAKYYHSRCFDAIGK